MLNSMTGYASLSGNVGQAAWDWELRSLNGKGLDFRVRLPDGFEALEPVLRKVAKARLARGNVTATLKYSNKSGEGAAEVQTEGLAAALTALVTISETADARGDLALAPINAADVARMPGVIATAQDAPTQNKEEIAGQIDALFDTFIEMRQTEGAALGRILKGQLDSVAELIAAAFVTAEARQAKAGDLLKARVTALLETTDLADESRLAQELAVLAVKADVTEEIDRLKAHVDAARGLLSKGGAVGRKLDFLMQEFNREANTLCSKSGSTELTQIGMDLKVLIDQMREQVQNLE